MGIRLKALVSILVLILLYAIYYFVLPLIINLDKFNPQITNFIKQEYGYKVDIQKPSFKFGLSPSIWLKADKFQLLNDDGTPAFYTEKPVIKVSLLPLILGRVNLKYFSSDNIFIDLYCDKELRVKLGQYLLIQKSDDIVDVNGAKIFVNKFTINLQDLSKSNKIKIVGNYFNLSKFKENKRIDLDLDADIISNNSKSKIYIDLDAKLPLLPHLDDYPPELTVSFTNINLGNISNFISYFSNGFVKNLDGIINFELHSDKLLLEQKQYKASVILDKIKFDGKYFDKPYYYKDKIQLNSLMLLEKNSLSIPNFSVKTPKFSMKLSGDIDKITSKNQKLDLNFKMLNARSEDLLEILPYSKKLEKLIKIYPSVAKDCGFYSDVNVDLNIKNDLQTPDIYGYINLDNAYAIEPIKKAPKGAHIGIKFDKDFMNIDVNVPTDINQYVSVNGKIKVYGERDVKLDIKSTDKIDLFVAKKVLVPVHETLDFELGPVPDMYYSGFGNIDLKVTGNKKDPHLIGKFSTINASAGFNDIKNLELKNANANLYFKDTFAEFNLKSGTINNKPINIDGTCDFTGKLDFKVKAQEQDLGKLLLIIKSSPMLKDLQKFVTLIEDGNGKTDFYLNLTGQIKQMKEIVFGKNLHAKGEINLLSNAIKPMNLNKFTPKFSGKILYDDFNINFDIKSLINTSKITAKGEIKNNQANINFTTDKIKFSELFAIYCPNFITLKPTGRYSNSYMELNGKYQGAVDKFEMKNFNVKGSAYFNNLSFVYNKKNLPIEVISGFALINNNTLTLNKINMLIGTMPTMLDGNVKNLFNHPYVTAYVSSKPNQKFIDTIYNRNSIYPIKAKGEISFKSAISGYANKLSSKSSLYIDKDSSLYYMGATLGNQDTPLHIYLNSQIEPKKIHIKSFLYDKIITSQNGRTSNARQLSASGIIYPNKKIASFENFAIKTAVPTDMKIFNIVFKKPLIKSGHFISDIVINGNFNNPKVRGIFKTSGVDIPFFDVMIKDVSLNFYQSEIAGNITGDVLSNSFNLDFNAQNRLTKPYVINDVKVNVGNLNINRILDTLNVYEMNSLAGDVSVKQLNSIDLKQIIIKNIDIIAKNIFVYNIHAHDLNAKLNFKNNIFNVENFKFNLAQGQMDGSVKYNLVSNKSEFDLNVKGADADKLMTALFDIKEQFFGDLSGQLNLSCTGRNQADCLKTLNGYGAFLVKDGRMPKLGSLEYLLKAGNLIKSGITGLSINGLIDLVTPLKTGNFASIKGAVEIHNGIADKIQILSTGKDLNIYVTGEYNLSTYNADMYVFGRLSKKITTILGPIGNLSLNTLFNSIPGVNLNDPSNAKLLNDINKLPGLELSNKAFRVFAVEIHGDVSGDDYVDSFRWIE